MKRPISWHAENLRNMQLSLEKEEKALEQQEKRVWNLRIDIDFAKYQIDKAKEMGKIDFDGRTFGRKK